MHYKNPFKPGKMKYPEILKKYLKKYLGALFFYGGLFHILRFINNITGKRITIVSYHRITGRQVDEIESSLPFLFTYQRTFKSHLKFMRKWYRIMTFEDLSAHIQNKDIPWDSLIITFDDGYEDNYSQAYPVLKELDIPATFFIVSGRIGAVEFKPFWWDRAYYYFRKLKEMKSGGATLSLGGEMASLFEEFEGNPSLLFKKLNEWESGKIENLLDEFGKQNDMPAEDLISCNRMLTWDAVLEMRGHAEFGSHTCSHGNLLEMGREKQLEEINASKKKIEQKVEKRVTAFSYPAGNTNEQLKALVREAGYSFAVTAERDINRPEDRYALKRINIWEGTVLSLKGGFSKGYLACKLLGF